MGHAVARPEGWHGAHLRYTVPRLAREAHRPPPADGELLARLLETLEQGAGGGHIRCPRCAWRPRASDRWSCRCGCAWNTFETRGRCPECAYQWRLTQCLSCQRFSPHDAWYVQEPEQA